MGDQAIGGLRSAPPEDGAVAIYVERIRAIAREHGYAVGVHGSLARDLDLLAVPWMVEAVSAQALVSAICEGMGLRERAVNLYGDPDPRIGPNPEPKPWGRLAWSLAGCPPSWKYVDLSVAPRAGEAVPVVAWRETTPPPSAGALAKAPENPSESTRGVLSGDHERGRA